MSQCVLRSKTWKFPKREILNILLHIEIKKSPGLDEIPTANGRHESGSAYGGVKGAYYLADADGRFRRAEYVADKWGFRAMVKTNEPGTKTSYPAAAPYHSANGKHVPSGYGGFHG
ncbi:hypothetical protein MRX96_023439 [Rhipicephalus microplus]